MLERLSHDWRVARTGSAFAFFFGGGALLAGALPVARRLEGDPEGFDLRAQRWIARGYRLFVGYMELARARARALRGRASACAGPGPLLVVANHPTLVDTPLLGQRMPQADCIANPDWADNPLLRGAIAAAHYVRNDAGAEAIEEGVRRHPPGAPRADLPGRHADAPRCRPRSPAPGRRPHRAAGRRGRSRRSRSPAAAHADEGAALVRRARARLRRSRCGCSRPLAPKQVLAGGRDGVGRRTEADRRAARAAARGPRAAEGRRERGARLAAARRGRLDRRAARDGLALPQLRPALRRGGALPDRRLLLPASPPRPRRLAGVPDRARRAAGRPPDAATCSTTSSSSPCSSSTAW